MSRIMKVIAVCKSSKANRRYRYRGVFTPVDRGWFTLGILRVGEWVHLIHPTGPSYLLTCTNPILILKATLLAPRLNEIA